MTAIQVSVDVARPVRTVYNQWTQFESFPAFMSGVDRVVQKSDTRARWETSIGGVKREFDTEITEQRPDERIAWTSLDEPKHGGVVTFHRIDDHSTRVHLQMEYEPNSIPEKAGAALGVVQHRIKGDLNRFRDFIEHRRRETGSWRGAVPTPRQHDAGAKPGNA
ncbi:SRPBCC family protein [Haloechinothrix halophila]|uniref:SRPBCC family protein n=1 Tax=Haloechinothrix halophila TaxID=1069073 RepID=UPI00040A3A10|nr:SRPBCC family protein [Haloechinothrix halophila]